MSDLLERLRGRGWRMTSQRRVVAEVLDGEHVHLTADEVHARAVQRLPEISRATVYNTLGELVSLGEVMEVSTDGRAKRYDPNAHHPHQHLVCSGCGDHPRRPPDRQSAGRPPGGGAVRLHGVQGRGHLPRVVSVVRPGGRVRSLILCRVVVGGRMWHGAGLRRRSRWPGRGKGCECR